MLDASTGNPAVGLTVTGERAVDGAAYVAMSNSVSEISDGTYKVNISNNDVNGGFVMWKFEASGAKNRYVAFITEAV